MLVAAAVVIGAAIGGGDDVVVVEKGVAGGRFDAAAGRGAGHDDRSNAVAAQDQVEVGAPEAAVAVLLDRHLARAPVRSDRVAEVGAPGPFQDAASGCTG